MRRIHYLSSDKGIENVDNFFPYTMKIYDAVNKLSLLVIHTWHQ